MMVLVNNDILVVIGGKNQIFCEKYSISLNNWRKIPILPEERYQGCLLVNKKIPIYIYLVEQLMENLIVLFYP